MSGAHDHGDTARDSPESRRRLRWTLVLVVAYMLAEVIGGLLSGSLALLADAAHMLSDAAALGLALFAIWLADQPATSAHTYGFYRSEILAALVNGATLVAIAFFIFAEAWQRLQEPPEVGAGLMMAVAAGGLVINVAGLFILRGGKQASLNVRSAWLHVLADTLGSVQVILAGSLIYFLGWKWADPVASAIIGCLVLYSSWSILRESVSVLMESSPAGIDVDEVRSAMLKTDGVKGVHDLHIWTITSGYIALSVHALCQSGKRDDVLNSLRETLREEYGIYHTTIQVESPDSRCPQP